MGWHRSIRWFGIAILASVVLVAGIGAAALAFVATQGGRDWLARSIAEMASTPGEVEIEIVGFGPGLPGEIRFSEMTIADAAGVWLRVDRAAIDWSPWSLLRGRVLVADAEIGAVRVLRLPEDSGPEPEKTAGVALPVLPVVLRIDRLAVAEVRLDEPVLGAAAAFAVSGALADDGGVTRATLEVARIDGFAGEALLDAAFDRSDGRLELRASAREPAGGAIARLLDLAPYPPVTISLTGSGPVTDWRGRLDAEAQGLVAAAADVALTIEDAPAVTIVGHADVRGLLGADLRPLVGSRVEVRGGITMLGDDLAITDFAATAPVGSVQGGGRIGLDPLLVEAKFALAVDGAGPVGRLVAPVRFRDLSGTLNVSGAFASPALAASGTISGLETGEPAIAVLLGNSPTWRLDGEVDLDAQAIDVRGLRIVGPGVRVGALGSYSYGDDRLDAAIDAEVPALAAIAPAVGLPMAGSGRIEAFIAGSPRGILAGTATVEIDDFDADDDTVNAVLGRSLSAAADFRIDGGRTLSVADGVVDAEGLHLELNADLHDGLEKIEAAFRIRAPDFAVVSGVLGTAVSGAAVATGTVAGPVAGPTISGTANGDEITVAGMPPTDVAAAFAVPGSLDRVHFERIEATTAGVIANGAATVPFDGTPIDGRFAVRLDSGDTTRAIGAIRWLGSGTLDATLRADGAGQAAEVRADVPDLAVSGATGELARVRDLRFSASALDPLRAPRGRAQVMARRFTANGVGIADVAIDVDGGVDGATVTLGAARIADVLTGLAVRSRVAEDDGAVVATVESLEARLGERLVALTSPAAVRVSAEATEVGDVALAVGDGRLAGGGSVGPGRVAVRIEASDLPLALVRLAVPGVVIDGRIDANAVVRTEDGGLAGDADVQLRNVRVIDDFAAEMPAFDGRATVHWSDGIAELAARIPDLFGHELDITASVPVAVDADLLEVRVDRAAPVSASVRWQGEVGPVWEALPLGEHRLTGPATVDLALTGSLGAPQIGGRVGLDGGAYEHLVAGTLLRDLVVGVTPLANERLALRMAATDSAAGRLEVDGEVNVHFESDVAASATLTFTEAVLLRRDDVTATAGGEIAFSGTAKGGLIEGRIETSAVEVRLVDRLPPSVVDIKVTDANRPPADPDEEAVRPWDGALDVVLDMPRRVFVRGRGLDSEWAGSFRATGPTAEPRIEGAMTLVRGQFEFAGKRFELTQGRVSLDGRPDVDPEIEMVAEHTAGDITAVFTVRGRASAPSVSLSSRPALPRDEILSRVLFGRSAAKLGPVEALQLAVAVDTLTGDGESVTGGVFDFARRTLGVDTISVEPGTDDGAAPSVSAGRYVGERTFIGVKQGADLESGAATVEVEVTPNLSVQSDVGQDATGSLGVQWKRDY